MRLQVKGRNIELTPSIREYVEAKFARLDRQLAEETPIEVELGAETKHSLHTAEAIVFTKGPTLRASESMSDQRAAIDRLVANLERQIVRYREKRRHEPRRRTAHHGA